MNLQRSRILRLTLLLIIAVVSASVLFAAPNPGDYPLQIHIYQNHWGGSSYNGYHGFGRANLIDGSDAHAMEYTFDCEDHFMANDSGEAYPAKWKKPGREVEMLVGLIGSGKVHKCTMKVALKDFVYSRDNGELRTISLDQYKAREANRAERQQAMAPTDTDTAHYPLKLTILNISWGGAMGGIISGMGQGNLYDAASPHAVDFTLSCPIKIPANPEGRYYRGKWMVQGSSMTLLLHKLGDPTVAATCDVKTILHDDVYIRKSEGDIKAVSQQQYKSIQQAENTPSESPSAQ